MRRALVPVLAISLAACATGQRPTLVDDIAIRDPATQVVLDQLDAGAQTAFSATYLITPTLLGQSATTARVLQSGSRQKVTIGSVEFFTDGNVSRTCDVGGANCTQTLDDGRVSNLQVTHSFFRESIAARLELDAARTVANTVSRADSIAGRPATCVDVSVPALDGVGIVVYCSIAEGIIGRYVGADLSIELTEFSPIVDETLLV